MTDTATATSTSLAAIRRLYAADQAAQLQTGRWPARGVIYDGRPHSSSATLCQACGVAVRIPSGDGLPQGLSYAGIYIHVDAAAAFLAEISE